MQTQNIKSAKKMKTRYHCSIPGCLYFTGSERSFAAKKFLNQHIAKVHAEKIYSCGKCRKGFGLDSLRKLHEKTCGIEWKCTCGVKYSSRESVLTHARRTQHVLPDHVLYPDKMRQSKYSGSNQNPIILLIQPIIQNLACIQPVQAPLAPRPILPKTLQPHILSVSSVNSGKNMCNLVYPSPPTEKFVYSNITQSSARDSLNNQLLSAANGSPIVNNNNYTTNNNVQKLSVEAGTQTSNDLEILNKRKESRASQCSRRKSKSAAVGIESTHTQTAESAVVKIKRKKSRRKSVAIATEPSIITGDESNAGISLWPNFKDLILQENVGNRAVKNTTSTQTSSNKILCDSQTITDDELFKLVWDDAVSRKDSNDDCNSPFGMLQDIAVDDSLSAISEGLSADALNMFASSSPVVDSVLTQDIKIKNEPRDGGNMILSDSPSNKGITNEPCTVFETSGSGEQDMNNKVMHIYTQTMASNVLDYNLLANMETQTTDDFFLYDLELLDTETQTPWEDFPNIDDSPVSADHLSIEIQTDFSSQMDQDPYDFINNLNVQSMGNECSTKESFGVNSETQTHDWANLTQFTNSESQTLDLANLFLLK